MRSRGSVRAKHRGAADFTANVLLRAAETNDGNRLLYRIYLIPRPGESQRLESFPRLDVPVFRQEPSNVLPRGETRILLPNLALAFGESVMKCLPCPEALLDHATNRILVSIRKGANPATWFRSTTGICE